jgi:putative transposase
MQPSTYYHIYNHANGFENLFQSDENYRFFLAKWGKYIAPVADTYAYCLMPNHFHALIRIKDEEKLKVTFRIADLTGFQNLSGLISKQFSNLFNSYAKAYNKQYNRRGSLFNRPFKAKQITSDTYLTRVIFYIHHNPLHHGFTKHIADWPHSSYHAVVSDKPTHIKRKEVQNWFGSKRDLEKFHHQAIKDLDRLENEFT